MYVRLKKVKVFSTLDIGKKVDTYKSSTPSIYSYRHLMNKITAHTNPVVTIDHKQTAHLALLNGIRSTPTTAKGMPPSFRNNPEGGTYGNDGDYDARLWGLDYSQMTLEQKDFVHRHSQLVIDAIKPYLDGNDMASVIEHDHTRNLHITECCELIQRKIAEKKRKAVLACLHKTTNINICECDNVCSKGCYYCDTCMSVKLVGELMKKPEEIYEPEEPVCPPLTTSNDNMFHDEGQPKFNYDGIDLTKGPEDFTSDDDSFEESTGPKITPKG